MRKTPANGIINNMAVKYTSHTATPEDRKKDSYLSSDSKVVTKQPLKPYQALAKSKAKRLSSKEAGVPSTNMINPKQFEKQKADRKRWSKEKVDKSNQQYNDMLEKGHNFG